MFHISCLQIGFLDLGLHGHLLSGDTLEPEWQDGSNSRVFSPVLSRLAAEATSYYAWALGVTIIIIMRRLGMKSRSTHLADELLNDLRKKKVKERNGTRPEKCVSSLFPTSLFLSSMCVCAVWRTLFVSVAHSMSRFLSVTFETNEAHITYHLRHKGHVNLFILLFLTYCTLVLTHTLFSTHS